MIYKVKIKNTTYGKYWQPWDDKYSMSSANRDYKTAIRNQFCAGACIDVYNNKGELIRRHKGEIKQSTYLKN